jgi:hypothetical protein
VSGDDDPASLDEVEDKLAEALVILAGQGSVPAANAALKLIQQKREEGAAHAHRATMEAHRCNPIALGRYLGQLGQSAQAVADIMETDMSDDVRAAWKAGQLERSVEIRAIELNQVRRGNGKIEGWMRRST